MTDAPDADMIRWLQAELEAVRDPEDAVAMAAYMKTDMPFYGAKRPAWKPVERALVQAWKPADADEYERRVLAIWALPHREEKYLAIQYATRFRAHIRPASLLLYERLVREGAWWDLVDPVAAWLVGGAYLAERDAVAPVMDRWIDDDDLWIRRTAILAQLKHKAETDADRLFRYCLRRADEKEFFIRKAIGWALREYAKTAPEAVKAFLVEHRGALSGLSYREGAKGLVRAGRM